MDTRDRLIELLAERAALGLDAEQSQELDALLAAHPEWDNDSFDLAAAAVDEAFSASSATLPTPLRDRLLIAAGQFTANASASMSNGDTHRATADLRDRGSASDRDGAVVAIEAERRRRETPAPAAPTDASGLPGWSGWVAAAAAVVLAALAWWPSAPVVEPRPDPVDLRAAMVAAAADVEQLPWQSTPDPAATAASGDVVWSSDRQEGYMRIRGLAANDPAENQYQLWIFDAQRDERFPVDGGVFDIPSGRDQVVVPIRATLPVDQPVLFAITVERPGGVVVSDRERIVLLAQDAASGD